MKLTITITLSLLMLSCTNYKQYPIFTNNNGIIETIKIEPVDNSRFNITMRIRTTTELYMADFRELLKNEIKKKAESLCGSGVKEISTNHEKIYTLDYVESENTRIRHRIDAQIECN